MKTEQTLGVLMEIVTLKMPHTHGGTDYGVGEQINVTPAQKAWLEQRAVIETDPQNQSGE